MWRFQDILRFCSTEYFPPLPGSKCEISPHCHVVILCVWKDVVNLSQVFSSFQIWAVGWRRAYKSRAYVCLYPVIAVPALDLIALGFWWECWLMWINTRDVILSFQPWNRVEQVDLCVPIWINCNEVFHYKSTLCLLNVSSQVFFRRNPGFVEVSGNFALASYKEPRAWLGALKSVYLKASLGRNFLKLSHCSMSLSQRWLSQPLSTVCVHNLQF